MAQLHINATVSNGSANVTLPGDVRSQIKVGDYFKLIGITGVYEINGTSLSGSDTQITLTAPYVGTSGNYPALIHRDFTEHGYPLIYAGDVDMPDILRRWALKADEDISSGASNALQKEQNLADVPNKTAARSNLGLGTAATRDVGTDAGNVLDVGAFDILIRDALRDAAEAASGGRVTVLYDDHGNPNWMHVLPRCSYEDLGYATEMGSGTCTAFIVNGVEKPEIFIGQYLASGAHAQSIAGADPRASINYDNAKAACAAKGQGWHLMTAHEWAAIALLCMANGIEPRGNTNWGRAHDATHETAVRQDGGAPGDNEGTARTMTGVGPAGWYHTNDHSGIADLVGNVWEWQHGLKFVNGRIICLPDNDFAAPESAWVEQDAYLSNESGAPTLMNAPGVSNEDSISQAWGSLAQAPGYTSSTLLRRLLIEPAGIHPQGRFYIRTAGERFPFRGGDWYHGSGAGLAALNAGNPRSHAGSSIGFRPAFVA